MGGGVAGEAGGVGVGASHVSFPHTSHLAPHPLQVSDLPYTTIATGHGPVLRHNVPELVGRYADWSAAAGKAPATVAVLYAADYGFSDRLAQSLARGVTKAGVATEMVDMSSVDAQELVEVVGRCAGVALLAPPADAAWAGAALATLAAAVKPKQKAGGGGAGAGRVGAGQGVVGRCVRCEAAGPPAALPTSFQLPSRLQVVVAESYGGRDEPVDTLVASLVDVGVSPLGAALRVKDAPGEGTYQLFEEVKRGGLG